MIRRASGQSANIRRSPNQLVGRSCASANILPRGTPRYGIRDREGWAAPQDPADEGGRDRRRGIGGPATSGPWMIETV
jgi:hypothetical protein